MTTTIPVPEGWIELPGHYDHETVARLSVQWEEAIKSGKTPVFEGGAKFHPFDEAARLRMMARRFLATLGKLDHPSAATDPVSALGQVAVDLQQIVNLTADRECQHGHIPADKLYPPKEV